MNNETMSDSKPASSMCDVMRDNTDEIIMKIESLLPLHIEGFTNIQSEYIRISRDFFGTCYIAEKELLEKIGVEQKDISEFDRFLKMLSQYTISEIDIVSNWQKTFVDSTISTMKVYDDYVKLVLASYAKSLEHFSSMIPKNSK